MFPTEMFAVSADRLRALIAAFQQEMCRGLAGQGGSLQMLPTYTDLSTGREKGSFLALDMGGTNVRILQVDLPGNRTAPRLFSDQFQLSPAQISSDAGVLFGAIARFIGRFLRERNLPGPRPLGFTFSFAMRQTSIAGGELIAWTKGWTAEGVVGRDVVGLLRRALAEEGLGRINVVSVNNDTTGTLTAGSYLDPDCDVGCILGTGTNICYLERVDRIGKPIGAYDRERMIINMESGNFNSALPRNRFDDLLDLRSENPGFQAEEKMVSGKYLGELARMVVVDLCERDGLFGDRVPELFAAPGGFGSERLSQIEEDESPDAAGVRARLREWGVEPREGDALALREIARTVSGRAARLAASVLAATVTKNDPDLAGSHTIAVDGGLFEKYPGFRSRMESVFRELYGDRASRLKLSLTPDGSGFGAAVIAAVASAP